MKTVFDWFNTNDLKDKERKKEEKTKTFLAVLLEAISFCHSLCLSSSEEENKAVSQSGVVFCRTWLDFSYQTESISAISKNGFMIIKKAMDLFSTKVPSKKNWIKKEKKEIIRKKGFYSLPFNETKEIDEFVSMMERKKEEEEEEEEEEEKHFELANMILNSIME